MKIRMKFIYLILVALVFVAGASIVFAQDDDSLGPKAGDDKSVRKDFVATLGDTDSFGDNVKFAGLVQSGNVSMGAVCPPPDPSAPDNQCVVLTPCPTTTRFNLRDIGRLTFPGNTAKDTIYLSIQIHYNYQLLNTTGAPVPSARFFFQPYLTIESEALNDPTLIDPNTGMPFNGSLDITFSADKSVNRSLGIGERDREALGYSRGTIYSISKIALMSNYNLPQKVADDMFRKPMTIRCNLNGLARCVSDANIFYAIRFFSD